MGKPTPGSRVDDRWILEWFEFGYLQLLQYLGNHAAFHQYLKLEEEAMAKNTLNVTQTSDGRVKIQVDRPGERAVSTTMDAREALNLIAGAAGITWSEDPAAVQSQETPTPPAQPVGGEQPVEPPVPGGNQ